MALHEYFITEDMIPGGKADGRDPSEFDRKELALGLHHEMEHTNDPAKALEIAMDHLTENPKYYTDMGAAKHFFDSED